MQRKNILIFVILIFVATLACGQGSTLPLEASGDSDSDVEVGDVSELATDTAEPTPVVHVMIPDELPEMQSGVIGDQDSSITADEKPLLMKNELPVVTALHLGVLSDHLMPIQWICITLL